MKTFEDDWLPFTNDFIFSMVMRDANICKGLLERILPDEGFSDVKLKSEEHPLIWDEPFSSEVQKCLKFGPDTHGVRFDAFVKSENMWAEIEMQTYSYSHLGKRSRYYHANMDMDFLASGKPYKDLKKTYIIFICTFDYMNQGEAVYRFENYDIQNKVKLDDEICTIILNTSCSADRVPEKLKSLYSYINNTPVCSDDSFIQALDLQVQKYNEPEWRQRQMTLAHLIEQAEDRMARLAKILVEENRTDDLLKAASDIEYRKKLFEEYDL